MEISSIVGRLSLKYNLDRTILEAEANSVLDLLEQHPGSSKFSEEDIETAVENLIVQKYISAGDGDLCVILGYEQRAKYKLLYIQLFSGEILSASYFGQLPSQKGINIERFYRVKLKSKIINNKEYFNIRDIQETAIIAQIGSIPHDARQHVKILKLSAPRSFKQGGGYYTIITVASPVNVMDVMVVSNSPDFKELRGITPGTYAIASIQQGRNGSMNRLLGLHPLKQSEIKEITLDNLLGMPVISDYKQSLETINGRYVYIEGLALAFNNSTLTISELYTPGNREPITLFITMAEDVMIPEDIIQQKNNNTIILKTRKVKVLTKVYSSQPEQETIRECWKNGIAIIPLPQPHPHPQTQKQTHNNSSSSNNSRGTTAEEPAAEEGEEGAGDIEEISI